LPGAGSSHLWQLTYADFGTPPTLQSFAGTFSIQSDEGSPSKPQIRIARESTNLVLVFDGKLYKADVVTGPYLEVPGATSPWKISAVANGHSYWRTEQ
jgi:hypothetical protein